MDGDVLVQTPFIGGLLICVITSVTNAISDVLRKKVMLTRKLTGLETVACRGIIQFPIFFALMYVDRFIDEFNHVKTVFDPTKVHPYYAGALFFSGMINMATSLMYFKALQYAPLSLTVPYLSLTPAFLLFSSWLLVGEVPSRITILGVVLLVAGGLVLGRPESTPGVTSPSKEASHADLLFDRLYTNTPQVRGKEYIGSLIMIAIAVLWSISAVLDKIGVSSFRHKADYGLWIHTLMTIPIVIYVLVFESPNRALIEPASPIKRGLESPLKRATEPPSPRNRKHPNIWQKVALYFASSKELTILLAVSALANTLAYWFQLEAIKFVHVSYVISVKRAGVLLTVIFGRYFFDENNFIWRIVSSGLMVVGVLLIIIAGHVYS